MISYSQQRHGGLSTFRCPCSCHCDGQSVDWPSFHLQKTKTRKSVSTKPAVQQPRNQSYDSLFLTNLDTEIVQVCVIYRRFCLFAFSVTRRMNLVFSSPMERDEFVTCMLVWMPSWMEKPGWKTCTGADGDAHPFQVLKERHRRNNSWCCLLRLSVNLETWKRLGFEIVMLVISSMEFALYFCFLISF